MLEKGRQHKGVAEAEEEEKEEEEEFVFVFSCFASSQAPAEGGL